MRLAFIDSKPELKENLVVIVTINRKLFELSI